MCYNISATNAAGQRPVATQKNNRYYYLSPSGFLLHWSRFVTGNLGGLCFWDRDMTQAKKPLEEYYKLAHEREFIWLGPEVKRVIYKTEWQCQNGHKFEASFNNIQRGSGCPHCAGNARKKAEDYHGLAGIMGFVWLGPEVSNTGLKTEWQCQKEHRWKARYDDIRQGKGCPYCANRIPKSTEDYHKLTKGRGFTWLGPEVTRIDIKTRWQCRKGHIWEATFDGIQRGTGCPYCANRIPKSTEDYHKLAENRNLVWLGPSVTRTVYKTEWRCQRGHEWKATFDGINQGSGCPICRQSRGEKAVASFLNYYGIIHNRGKRFDKCRVNRLLAFDFYF